eukprot:4541012-Amphidinium_carterae.2
MFQSGGLVPCPLGNALDGVAVIAELKIAIGRIQWLVRSMAISIQLDAWPRVHCESVSESGMAQWVHL